LQFFAEAVMGHLHKVYDATVKVFEHSVNNRQDPQVFIHQ